MTTTNEIGNSVGTLARGLISCWAVKLAKSIVNLSFDITSSNFFFMPKCQSKQCAS